MKNISRRVFIKGMAVAAVATAASTVLTGCKFPGVDEPVVEAPVESKVMTFTNVDDSGKTLTLTFSDLIKPNVDFDANDKNKAKFNVLIDNNIGQDITFNPASVPSTDNTYYVVISTYRDGYTGMGNTSILATTSGNFGASDVTVDNKTNALKPAELTLTDVESTVTIKVALMQTVSSSKTPNPVTKIAEKEITYTL